MEEGVTTLMNRLSVGRSVASELMILSGEDVDMAIRASNASIGLDHCKARIIDERLSTLQNNLVETMSKLAKLERKVNGTMGAEGEDGEGPQA